MLLWMKYLKETSVSEIGTAAFFLLVFSNNCAYSTLKLYPNLASGSFLNVSCHVEFETVTMYFLYSVTLKSNGLSWTLNGSFTEVWICNIGHLKKKNNSLSYANLPDVDTFHYTIPKNYIRWYHHSSHQKVMRSHHIKVWIKVSKISLFPWKQIFIRSNECCQWLLSGCDRLASFSFWDQCLPDTQDPAQDRHMACCHTLSGSSCLGQIFRLSLFLMTWTVLRSPG